MSIRKIFYWQWIFLFLAACSQEEIVISDDSISDNPTTVDSTPIAIQFQSQVENMTRASVTEDDLFTTMDKVRILVFSSEGAFTVGTNNFVYTPGCIASDEKGTNKTEVVDCVADDTNGTRIAKAYFVPTDKNKIYRIYAIAYNEARWGDGVTSGIKLHVDGKKLYYGETLVTDADSQTPVYESIEASGFTFMEVLSVPDNQTARLDFFVGPVGFAYQKSSDKTVQEQFVYDIVDGSKKRPLEGKLYRASGRLSFHLTKIDKAKYKKVRLIMEKYTTKSIIGLSNLWLGWRDYEAKLIEGTAGNREDSPVFLDVFGACWSNQAEMITVDETDVSDAGEVNLYADCIAAHGFKIYVEPLDENGKGMGRFLVQCKDKAFYPGYIGIKDMIVENGLFTILGNYWGKLSGEFNNIGNIKMDITSWEDWETYPTDKPLS